MTLPVPPTLFRTAHPHPGSALERAYHLVDQLAGSALQRDRDPGPPATEVQALRSARLLDLTVPRAHGGQGADWPSALEIVRVLSHDGSGNLT
ncbi:hypothetical protein ACINK0_18690 (plasmid) [Deinococcus sp. VB343]|uniref:Acyl-CoA dehydrogenase n=1 Tax=Deinococcus sp. VB142 TaxID=3112952 RepID=A0AAU6Q7B8_9DEIO